MAEIETSLVNNMKSQSTITNLVGSRIYELSTDGEAARKPYVVVRPTTNVRGSFTQTEYGGVARLSIYVHAETVSESRNIGSTVMDVYKQFSGTLDSHEVQYVEVSNARVLYGPGDEFRYLVDLVIHFTE